MSSDATLRELKAGLEDNTTMAVPQPWSFRPMDAEAGRCRSVAWGPVAIASHVSRVSSLRSPHLQGESHMRVAVVVAAMLFCMPVFAQGVKLKSVTNSIGMELIEIPAGKFTMGMIN